VRAQWAGPLGAYPELGDGAAPSGVTPAQLAAEARRWHADGARAIGGCCGTGAEHIRAVAAAVRGA
jgi:methionine synthase I (cobalamin-dependent)